MKIASSEISKKLKMSVAATVILSCFFSLVPAAHSQTQHWNTAARERSQRLCSAAINRLVLSKVDEALPLLTDATHADQTDALAFLLLGMVLNIQGRPTEALDALRQADSIDKKSREILLSAGFSHFLNHNYEKAVDLWTRLTQSNRDVLQLYTDIGFAYLRAGKTEEAETNLRECAKRSSYSHAAYRGLALLHYLNGNFPIARSAAQQAGAAGGRQVPLLLAEMEFLQGNAQGAKKQLAAVPKITKNTKPTFNMVSIGYLPQHDFHFDPFSSDYFDNESLIEARFVDLPKRESSRVQLTRKGKAEDALSAIKNQLSNSQNDPYLILQCGMIRLANANYADASEDFIKVIKLAPDWHIAKLYLSLSRFRENNLEKAKYALDGFEKANPGKQLAPVFAMIKSAQLPAGQAAAPEKKDELIIPGSSAPPSKGDAGF